MIGFRFTDFIPENRIKHRFDELFSIFSQLLNITAGDVSESLNILNQLDRKYGLTDNDYGIGDFINDLKERNFIKEDPSLPGTYTLTSKTELALRQQALEEIFSKLKKSGKGNHNSPYTGTGDESSSDRREFQFGDSIDQLDITQSIKNSQVHHGINEFRLTESDLEIEERELKTINSTVLLIDISHSMILYGEDRITPAKKVAMALSELILTKYPNDTLDLAVFGDEAWPIQIKDLPYLQVGPYHTNTYAGIELAIDILRRRKTNNKQIFMITDGKPSCLKIGAKLYKNSFGLDRKIINKTLDQAARCRKFGIQITTFMIARDAYLQEFIRNFTKINQGRAYYSSLTGLGEYVFEDYVRNRRKKVR